MAEPTSKEDPKALAARLAAEARARMAPPAKTGLAAAAPPPGRLAAAPPPAAARPKPPPPAHDDASDERFLSEPPAPVRASKPKAPAPPPPPPAPLAERAQGRSMSAADALKAALAAEAQQEAKLASAPAASTPAPAPRAAASSRPGPAPAPAPPVQSAGAIVSAALPSAVIGAVSTVDNPVVFKAVWQSHRAQGAHRAEWGLVATACVLIDAADRVPAGSLQAVRIGLGGGEQAAFVDASRGTLLGIVGPADLYLAGLV